MSMSSSSTSREHKAEAAEAVRRAVADVSVADADTLEGEMTMKRAGLGKGTTDPDIPSCDACGREFAANLVCGRCQSAYYCTKICQKNAWKAVVGGHKQLCDGRKEQCRRDAKRVVAALSRRNNDDCQAMEGDFFEVLSGAGAYKAAVAEGLHEALCGLFRENAEHVVEIFSSDGGGDLDDSGNPTTHVWAATRTVMCSLFRGQRAEGRAVKRSSFGCVDGQRIKAYVNSAPEAFDVWMNASISTIRLPFNDNVWRRRGPNSCGQHTFAHRAARDTIAGWILVWMNKRASRAILLPAVADDATTETAAEAAKTRAQSIADRLRVLLEEVNQLDQRDTGGVVQGMIYQSIAMLSYRLREFEIDSDFSKQLKMKGLAKNKYEQMAVPIGEATIEKGGTLTNVEAKAAMAACAPKPQSSRRGRR
jgi:hypothetical protein